MRYAVLADIHGNLEALRAALAEARRRGAPELLVLGDLVGYGPEPNGCVELVAELDATCVRGNHDLIALGRLSDERCIPLARESLRWTREVLRPEASRFLERLPLRARAQGGVVLAHGSLDDPESYTASPQDAAAQLARLAEVDPGARFLLLGHTHRPLALSAMRGWSATSGAISLAGGDRAVLNPGSVGQSREWRARVRLLILDTEHDTAEFVAVSYDDERSRAALRRSGLSERGVHLRPSAPRYLARAARARVQARRLRRRGVPASLPGP